MAWPPPVSAQGSIVRDKFDPSTVHVAGGPDGKPDAPSLPSRLGNSFGSDRGGLGMSRRQQEVIDYPYEENRVLRKKLGVESVRLNDG